VRSDAGAAADRQTAGGATRDVLHVGAHALPGAAARRPAAYAAALRRLALAAQALLLIDGRSYREKKFT